MQDCCPPLALPVFMMLVTAVWILFELCSDVKRWPRLARLVGAVLATLVVAYASRVPVSAFFS